jgi:hypothetical protein
MIVWDAQKYWRTLTRYHQAADRASVAHGPLFTLLHEKGLIPQVAKRLEAIIRRHSSRGTASYKDVEDAFE